MNYGPDGIYDTTANDGIGTSGNHHHHHSFHNHSHTIPYSNGFHNPLKLNSQNRLDDNEGEQQQQQSRTDDNYELDDINRPRLLMWGLTKYKI